jgi:hypothetical protein
MRGSIRPKRRIAIGVTSIRHNGGQANVTMPSAKMASPMTHAIAIVPSGGTWARPMRSQTPFLEYINKEVFDR